MFTRRSKYKKERKVIGLNKKDFFYCYNKELFKFLHDEKGLEYITVAINPTTMNTFSMFAKSDLLQQALDQYKLRNQYV